MRHTNEVIKIFADTIGRAIPDRLYIAIRYRIALRKSINWKNPQTYNEKIQWMKLYDRNPEYTRLVDKFDVRSYVAETIGDEYLIPCLGVFNDFDEIDFSKLPDRFVLKCTHDSGSVVICRNKAQIDMVVLKKHFDKYLKHNSFYGGREWAYKNVKPRIIAEAFMVDDSGIGLKDYKFFCFGGSMKSLFVATERGVKGVDVKFDFFDENYVHMPFKHGHENATLMPSKPVNFNEMKQLAEKLSQGFRHVRVDLYNVNGRVYFGEMTFYHHCGFVPFTPEKWDYTFGGWLDIDIPLRNES